MAKKWAEVVNSEGYQKLPDAEKTAAQEQYFSQVVAPNVPEDDVDVARKQFFDYASGLSSKRKGPTTFAPPVAEAPKNVGTASDSYGIMGEGIEPDAAFAAPRSIMNGVENLPTSRLSKTPLRPEVLKAFESRYDAATPEQRKVLEAQPNWMGDVARARAAQMEQLDEARKRAPGKTLERIDPRVEARTQALIDKGEKPEFARVAAEEAAGAGITPGREIDYMRYKGLAEPRQIDEKIAAEFENASTAKRAIERGRSAIRKDIYGLAQFAADKMGANEFAEERGKDIEWEKKFQDSIGENLDYWKRDYEDAGASIAEQAPLFVVSALSGGTTAAARFGLGAMWVQQFGGNYAESKQMGLDKSEATDRAAWMATAELLGEIPSFGAELKLIRGMLKTAPLQQLKGWVLNTAKTEITGEELTYGLQTLGDVKGQTPWGANEAPTPEQFVDGMVKTLKQTVIQSAMMGGGTAALGKTAQVLLGRKPEQELPVIPSAEQLMREKGFLTGVKKKEEPSTTTTKKVSPFDLTDAQKAELRKKRVDEVAAKLIEVNGLPAEDAIKVAEQQVSQQDANELKYQGRLQREVEARETLIEPAKDRVEELTQDFIGAGFTPEEAQQHATAIAKREAEHDASAEAEAKGANNVRRPIVVTGELSPGVPSRTATGSLTGGTSETVSSGLGAAGTTTRESAARKTVQLDTLRDNVRIAEDRLEEAKKVGNEWDILNHENDLRVAQEALAKGEADVAQAIKTEQTETQGQETSTAGQPKKRGRPALTPELKSVSEQKRTQQRTAYKATEKKLNDAKQLLAEANAPIDEGAVESEEQLREMLDDKRRKRNAAIRTLYDISKTNKGKPGQRAAEALKDPSITERELVAAAEGHELRKKTGAIGMSSMSKVIEAAAADTVADEKLGKVTNGAQAITQILKTGNEFQKILARRIRSVVSGVQIVVVEANQPTPEIFLKSPRYMREWNRARAVYVENDFSRKKVIYVRGASFGADQGVNNITMLHELLHAATNRKIQLAKQAVDNGQYSDKALINAFNDLVEVMDNAGARFNELMEKGRLPAHISNLARFGEIFDDPREFLAYGMTDPAMQEFLKTAYGQQSPVGYFNRFVDSIRNFFGMDVNDANALADLINATDAILSSREVGTLEPLGTQISASTKSDFGDSKTLAARPGANAMRMGKMLGAKLYGKPDKIADVSVKELFQNSFDAIKGAFEKGELTKGKINIELNQATRTIRVTDNGSGMPASVMGNEFLQIAGTVKETKRASGGLGVAKMLFLFENKNLEVVSLRNGQLSKLVTTGDELKAAMAANPSTLFEQLKDFISPEDIDVIKPIIESSVAKMRASGENIPEIVVETSSNPADIERYKELFPDGHGTSILIQIPDAYVDDSTGDTKYISFNEDTLSQSKVLNFSPLFDDIEVVVKQDILNVEAPKLIGANFPINQYTSFANINFEWGSARIYVSKDPLRWMPTSNTHVLSNGLWQFDLNIMDRPGWNGQKIPRHFYIDVIPKEDVKPDDSGYPFELNRQGFSVTTKEDFDKIFKYITAIYSHLALAEDSINYGTVQYINADGSLTEPKKLEPRIPYTGNEFTAIKAGDTVEVRDGVLYVGNRAIPELSNSDLEKTTVRSDELIIPQDEIDPNKVIVHDNTVSSEHIKVANTLEELNKLIPDVWNVYPSHEGNGTYFDIFNDNIKYHTAPTFEEVYEFFERRGILNKDNEKQNPSISDVGRAKFGKRFDNYITQIGDLFHALRSALIASSDGEYADLAHEGLGISFDPSYLGVSTLVPFRAMFINPGATKLFKNPKQAAIAMIGTMQHEFAHFRERNHEADFASEMQKIMALLTTSDVFNMRAAEDRFVKFMEENWDIFSYLNKEFHNGNITARASSFKDGSRQELNGSPFGAVEGAGTSRPDESGVSGSIGPSYQGIGQVGVGAGATSQTKEDGEEVVRPQKQIDKDVDISIEKVRLSKQGEELARQVGMLQALRDPRLIVPAFKQIWKSATYLQRKFLVSLPSREFLSLWASDFVPELTNTNKLIENMGGLTQQLLNSVAILAQTVHKAYKADPTLQEKLEQIAYASTIAEIDPSDPKAAERSKKLDTMYKDLGFKGQQIYKLIKQHYETLSDYFSHLLDEQIINSRITPEARNRLMAMVRATFEAGKKITPYFPLVRRGDYWLAIGSGKHRRFYTFETMGERDAAAEGFAKERRTSLQQLKEDQAFVLGNDIGSMRRATQDSSALLKGMFDIIDSQDFTSPEAREELKDAVYQLYLNTMPEQSFRRQFINRKNITGFSTDLLRNISSTGIRMSMQLSKLKYSPLLRNSISAARDSIVGREELEPFVDEMQARVNEALNPTKSGALTSFINFFNRAAFLHFLSSMSSAILQPISIFQTGSVVLGSRYGYYETTKELGRMMKVWEQYGVWRKNPDGSHTFVPPSISNVAGYSMAEKRAVREAMERNVFQSTYAGALYNYKSVPTMEFDSVGNKVLRGLNLAVAGPMHTAERLSREIMFMASYRLNIKKGATHKQAVDNAVRDTNEALGNYAVSNRPIFMQQGIGKLLLQFTMYPLHITLFLLRNLKRAGFNKGERWEATKILMGTLGTTMILGGVANLPMFSMLMGFLGAFWEDEDKPQEMKDMDYETWWRTVWLPEKLGHVEIGGHTLSDIVDRGPVNAFTGIDIASRTSLNDLWLRDLKETKTTRESAIALAMEKAGPSANMVLAWADMYDAFMDGEYQKGIEKGFPAMLRNAAMAARMYEEGVIDKRGTEILGTRDTRAGELIARAVGFNSDILANEQKLAFKLQAQEQRIVNERTKILNGITGAYIKAQDTDKPEAWKKYLKKLEEMEKFNIKHPEHDITSENMDASIEKMLELRALAEEWGGVHIDIEKATPQQLQSIINATKNIEKRKQERK